MKNRQIKDRLATLMQKADELSEILSNEGKEITGISAPPIDEISEYLKELYMGSIERV